jgi:hypothetical protein
VPTAKPNPELLAAIKAQTTREQGVNLTALPQPPPKPSRKRSPTLKSSRSPAAGMTRRRKYHNQETVVDGLTFDSRREAARWVDLKAEQAAGRVTNLRRQVRFRCVVDGILICRYVADFTYVRAGRLVVEDVKSKFTAKLQTWRIKKRLMLACHGVDVQEVIT